MRYCGDCKYCYSNESMGSLHLCTNGNSEYLGEFVSAVFDPACEDYDGPEDDDESKADEEVDECPK